MTKLLPFLACLAILPLAPAVAKIRPVPQAIPAGEPVSCINLPIRQSIVRDDSTIDFFAGSKTYRVTLPSACPGLGFDRAFSYETSLTKLCSADIITVLQRAGGGLMRGASCGLAPFQPVTGLKP